MRMGIRTVRPVAAAAVAFAALLAVQSSASAVFVSSTADSYAVSSSLTATITGVVTSAAIPNTAEAMSANPPGSNVTVGPVLPVNLGLAPFLTVATSGTITDTANTLAAPADTATATSTVNGTALNVLGLVTIGATVLSSTSTSTDNPVLGSTGSSTVTGLTLSVLGVPVPVVVSGAPNQTINLGLSGLAGATLVINEQIPTGGVNSTGITTNALDLTFANSVFGIVTLNGSVIIAHSATTLNARGVVPEPSTFALMGIAAITFGLNHVRTRGRKFASDAA